MANLVPKTDAQIAALAPVQTVAGRTGAVTLSASDVSGLGTIATQAANSVEITGGSVSGITDIAVSDGGTGASTASGARSNLGLVIGTNVLAPNGNGSALSGLQQSQISGLVSDLGNKADLVGGVIPTSQIPSFAISEYLGVAANEAAMLALVGDRGDWCKRVDTSTAWILGSDDSSLLSSWVEVSYPSSPVSSVNGQVGAIVLGASDVGAQASDATLSALAGVSTSADTIIYATGADAFATTTITSFGRNLIDDSSASAARTTLGLGSIATQAANSVAITGGSVSGITDLAIADGGTGSSTEAAARSALGVAVGNNGFHDSAPVNGDVIYWLPKSQVAFTINGVYGVQTTSGTCTFVVKINGTAVTGLSAVAATSTSQDVAATAANTVAIGDTVTVEYSAASSPVNLRFNLRETR